MRPLRPKMAPTRRKMPNNWSKAAKDSARLPAMSPRRSTWYAAADVCRCSRLHCQTQSFDRTPKLLQGGPRCTRLSTMSPRRSTRRSERRGTAGASHRRRRLAREEPSAGGAVDFPGHRGNLADATRLGADVGQGATGGWDTVCFRLHRSVLGPYWVKPWSTGGKPGFTLGKPRLNRGLPVVNLGLPLVNLG